ncbi:MAG: hypothetical protein ACLTY5_07000 [Angelakisella sp.]
MKKRLLSALLALALVFVLLPTTALAGEVATKGDISIAGKGWNFTKSTSGYETVYYQVQSNNGVFSTSLENKTDCVYPTNPYLEITRNGNTITVIVHREVTITTNKGTNKAAEECIEVNKSDNQTTTLNLVIKGAEGTTNNTLTLECKGYGSALSSYQGDITITGGVTVNAKSTYTNSSTGVSARAINVFNGDLTISGTGTTVNAENKDRNYPTIDVKNAVTISDGATLTAKNTNGGKAISCRSITADGYDFMGRSGNSDSYTTLTGDDKATRLQEYSSIQIAPTPTPALEKSNVYVAGTNLYKNTAYTIQDGKPVMGGTYPGNYNIYFDAIDYVLHVKDANIDARGTTGIYGTSNIVFEGKNSITASTYGIYSYFKSSDLKISGTGSLEVKTIAGDPAIATAYDTSRSIIISGNDFTVTADTSGTTSYAIKSDKDLTITGGAAVTAKSNATRAIDIKGDLTVTNGSLKATSTSDSVPTVQVGGNASFTGSTVTITNNSTTQGKSGKNSYEVSTGLYVGGTLDIKNAAKVTSTVIGGNAIYAKGDITISGDNTEVKATNDAYKFSAISTNKTVNISDNSTVKAENLKRHQGDPTGETDPSTGKTYNACPAITGKIANKNTQNKLHIAGFTTSSAGSQNPTEGTPLYLDIAPGSVEPYIHHYKVTITRGDEVTRTNSPVVIAGTTLLNDTYYTITNNGSTVAEGTESNYNAFYDSETKTLKLNNAQISTTTNNAAIKISEDLTITVTGTNELKGNYNHCIESYNNFTINGTGTLNMTNTNSSSSAASVIYCGPYKNLTIAAEVIIKNEAQPGNLIFTVEENACSFAEGYNVYASTNVSGSPLEAYDAAKGSTYKYLRVTKENLAPTTPTTYTVTITAGDNMKRESGALTQEVTKGAAITEVKFMAASGHYFPADYVSKMNLPAGLTAEIRENSWYLIISGTPTSDVTINLPAASVRPTITVSMPTPVAGYTPATASDITLTYSDINKSISKNLTISNVVWQSYVSNGNESITPGNTLSSGDKFEAGTEYYVTIDFEGVSENYAIVPAADTTAWRNAEWGSRTMTLYFNVTGAPCNHEYTNDWLANGNTHWHECKLCRAHAGEVAHTFGDWITDTPATDTTDGSKHRTCSVCQYQENATIPKTGTGEIVPPTPDNPGTIVIIRPAEEEKPAQQPNPSTGANDLVGMAVAAAVVAVLGSVALLRKHD